MAGDPACAHSKRSGVVPAPDHRGDADRGPGVRGGVEVRPRPDGPHALPHAPVRPPHHPPGRGGARGRHGAPLPADPDLRGDLHDRRDGDRLMPHLTILYTPELEAETDMPALCRALADTLVHFRDADGSQPFPTGGVRVLAYPAAHAAVGDGQHDGGFAYFNLRIARGRSA